MYEFKGPFTAVAITGDEHLGELAKHPLYLSRRDTNGGVEYGIVLDSDLYGQGFLKLLTDTKTGQFSLGIYGTVADWAMPDGNGEVNTRLQEMHRVLGQSWSEFEKTRPLYLSVLQHCPEIPDRIAIPRAESIGQMKERLLGNVLGRRFSLREFFSNYPDIRDGFADYLRQTYLKKEPSARHWNSSQVIGHISKWSPIRREEAFRHFFEKLPEEKKIEMAITHAVSKSVQACGFNYNIGGAIEYRDGVPQLKQRIKISKDSWTVEADLTRQAVYYARTPDVSTVYSILPETLKTDQFFVKPAVTWTKDDFNTDVDHRFYREVRNKFLTTSPADPQTVNPMAGMIFAAYCSRNERKKWPTRMGLPDSDTRQEMREAQVPVLVHMLRKTLLNGGFIKDVEAFTDRLYHSHLADEGVAL